MLKYSALLALALFASPSLLVSSSVIDNNAVVQSSAIRKLQSAIHVAVDVTVSDSSSLSIADHRPTLPEWLASHRLNQGKHVDHNHESLESEIDCAAHGSSHKCHKHCCHSKGKTLDDPKDDDNNESPRYEVEINESEPEDPSSSSSSSSTDPQEEDHQVLKERNQGIHEGHDHASAEAELDCAGHGCDHHCHSKCIHHATPVQVYPAPQIGALVVPPMYVPPQLPTQIQGPKDVDGISMSAVASSSESSTPDIPSGGSTFIALNQGAHEGHDHQEVEAELDCASGGCSHKCHKGCCHSKGKCSNGKRMMCNGGKDHNFGFGKDSDPSGTNGAPNKGGNYPSQGNDDDDK